MSEEDFRKIAKEYAEIYFTKGIDSTKIFKYVDELEKRVEQLENIRKEAIEWCKCVVNSKTTVGELPNGKHTDMGYCLDLAEPLLKILEEGDNKE